MPQLPSIPFTQEGFAKIQADQAALLNKRAEILIRLQAAREMGDLSENGAYKAARFELGDTDRRLRQLQYLTRFGFVAPKPKNNSVTFGTQVTLKTPQNQVKYTLVNQYESDPAQNKLSIDSPLGLKLMGKTVGDTITLNLPIGNQEYTIIALN